ncbi:PBECR4 domain-containing protein [Lactiplantibacillus plantarum]
MKNESDYLKVNCFADIDYKSILQDYHNHFHGRAVEVKTNYKRLESFKVVFNQLDLPHLMGWEKVTRKRANASKIISLINDDKFTLENTRKHSNFNNIKNRMLNYNFIHEIFIDQSIEVCVMTSDMNPNPLKLDIVFCEELGRQAIILGLRKRSDMEAFVPTTLHTESLPNRYSNRRRTRVISLKWI